MFYNPNNLKLAKVMRSKMTKQEAKLWNIVRAKRLYGYKFKRQVLIGEYIADFVCEEKKLIIELDGGQHNTNENIELDLKRTEFLNNMGYKVIRFWNNEVNNHIEEVVNVILRNLE